MNKIIIIIRDGDLVDVRIPKGLDLEVEAVQIESLDPDQDRLRAYEDQIYEDDSMYSVDFEFADP